MECERAPMEESPLSPKSPADRSPESSETPRASHHRTSTSTRTRSRSVSSSTSPPRSSAVPFSWEQSPGIPKSVSPGPPASEDSITFPLLPLPPPVRSHSDLSAPRKRRSVGAASADPFAAALALCAKDLPDAGDEVEEFLGMPDVAVSRRSPITIAHRLRLFDLYGSCKATCAVVDATVRLPRPGSTGLLGRRDGSDSI